MSRSILICPFVYLFIFKSSLNQFLTVSPLTLFSLIISGSWVELASQTVISRTSYSTRPLKPWRARPSCPLRWPQAERELSWPEITCSSVRKSFRPTPPRRDWTGRCSSDCTTSILKRFRAKFCSARTTARTRPSSITRPSCFTSRSWSPPGSSSSMITGTPWPSLRPGAKIFKISTQPLSTITRRSVIA